MIETQESEIYKALQVISFQPGCKENTGKRQKYSLRETVPKDFTAL